MAFHPQRFIHAANIRLDVPVSVQTTERPGDQLRMEFEDATLQAFDEVIENCLRHDVDFLLLTGNVFIEADRSLRARLAILKGFQRLREREIQVFVVPGDMDPAEAWRAIPEMPDNVSVCYSSNPEPEELVVDDQPVTMVSSSTWLGNVDDFGIQVIARGGESVQPFRIGVISRARFEESRRIAAVAAASGDHVLGAVAVNPAASEMVLNAQQPAAEQEETGVTVWRSLETDGRSRPMRADDLRPGQQGGAEPSGGGSEESPDSGFLRYADEMLREAQLHFLALTGELSPSTSWRESGVVHSPGTTQPRSRLEAVSGTCSLVQVAEDGTMKISSLDTSCVDWKHLEIRVSAGTDLSTLLQQMKTRLLEIRSGASDRIWSVQWILRGSLPLLHSLLESDLDTALGVELDEVMSSVRSIRLLHDVQTLPDPWPVSHPTATLADQYQQLLTRPAMLRDAELQRLIDTDGTLSSGWKQRLTSVLPSLDPERILARLREDGAAWFEPSFHSDAVESEQEVPESSGDDDRFEESDVEEHEDAVAAATGEVVAEAYEDAEDDDEGELR
ncbi:MAG: putative metallophosphoesterase YhaO [Planctomycetota bacterium]